MKAILELTRAITDEDYHAQQFDSWGKEKNILFINPQLSGKYLYKMLLPSRIMRSEDINTAITTISKFDPEGQLLGGKEVELTDDMINWGEYFVFPFTTQPLVDLYLRIRTLNPEAKIVYSIDFNFYQLSDMHPYKYIFAEPSVVNDVEDNIIFSDIAMVTNMNFQKVLIQKLKELVAGKYKDVGTKLVVGCFPFMIDSGIMYENVEYEAQDILTVTHTPAVQSELEKTASVSKEIKKKDITEKGKNIPMESKPKAPKKTALKTVKNNVSRRTTTDKSTTSNSTRKRSTKK